MTAVNTSRSHALLPVTPIKTTNVQSSSSLIYPVRFLFVCCWIFHFRALGFCWFDTERKPHELCRRQSCSFTRLNINTGNVPVMWVRRVAQRSHVLKLPPTTFHFLTLQKKHSQTTEKRMHIITKCHTQSNTAQAFTITLDCSMITELYLRYTPTTYCFQETLWAYASFCANPALSWGP